MNCEEVQKQLSDLQDKSLNKEHAREMEDHLSACSLCSQEMASLAECRRLVSRLPAVEPPVGFTARVMAEVRETAHRPSLWERLFLPLQIKIPLQTATVVLIAVLAAYVYHKEPLQRESVVTIQPASSFRKQEETDKSAPPVVQAPATGSKTMEITEEAKLRVQKFKDSAQPKEPQSRPNSEERNKGIASSQPDAAGTTLSRDQVLSPAPLQEKSSARSEAASPPLEQSSTSRGAAKAAPPVERSSLDALQRRAAPSIDAFRSGTMAGIALTADHELVIRLKEPARDDKVGGDRLASDRARPERQLSTLEEEANNVGQARQRAMETGQAQTVWITIPANQYELFKKELADLANIDLETPTPGPKNDAASKSLDRLRIKVTILPPLSLGSPLPPQPSSR
jgi:Predicted integral membrane protein (DUF2275)/Putative zinc-finger